GRSGFALAQEEWEGVDRLDCATQDEPIIQAAQYLLIGQGVDSGDTSGYPAAVNELQYLAVLPEMDRTPTQSATGIADTADLNAFFGTDVGVPCN
ncbi:MAG TPA: hypothetical protein VMF60_00365, partial [Acidimicrobiales bacterium]|nr:hypothetical protein [Acidimicrobiales bacterium]